MNITGHRISDVLESDAQPERGMFGLSGSDSDTWWYASLYVLLENGQAIELAGRSVTIIANGLNSPAQRPSYEDFSPAIGLRVRDILCSDNEAFVILDSGRYIENAYHLPGGSRAILGNVSEWSSEERDECLTSWLTGHVVKISS